MSKKLRTVHIDNVEWKYAFSKGEVRVYQPNTKQIIYRMDFNSAIHDGEGVTPQMVKEAIEKRISEKSNG